MIIYKYPVPIADKFTLEIPWGYRILSFQVQNGQPFIWVQVDPEHSNKVITFHLIGTGQPHVLYNYVGTIQLDGFVWHLFKDEK